MSRKLKRPSQEITNLISRIEAKYKGSEIQHISKVESYFMAGLTVNSISLCLNENDSFVGFIKCLDGKV